MNDEMRAAARELSVRARLTFPTGYAVELDGGDVLRFAVEEGADSPLLPGCVLSAQMTLELRNDSGQWRYGGSLRGERPLVGSTVEMFVEAGEKCLPYGVFVVSGVSARERSGCASLTGSDSIATELSGAFEDRLSYPATLQQVWEQLVGQTRYVWSGSIPNGGAVVEAKPEWGDVTLRRAAGWIAQAAGCFVRASRAGALEIVPCVSGTIDEIDGAQYMSLSDGFESFGPVSGLTVAPAGEGETEPYTLSLGLGEMLSIEGNPLFTADSRALAEGTLEQLAGLTLSRADFRWRGDPDVGVGARVRLTDTMGDSLECTVTRQTLRFDSGFSAECFCETPELNAGGVMRAITPEGGVNADALVGVIDGGLLAAGSVTARHIAAGAITAEKIAAGSVTADKLSAGSVTADKIETGALTAGSIEALTAALGSLTAGDIAASELYAAFAHLVELSAGSVRAGSVESDRLASALAEFVTLHTATGEFDLAAIQNLLASALILERGTADRMMITNLVVTSANLLSAVIGKLVVKGGDGKYYQISVGSDGLVSAEEAAVAEGEIAAGQTEGGKQIVETELNVGELNAQYVAAAEAVISEIFTRALTAGSITAGEALIASATIPALYTTAIRAIGEGIDVTANSVIRLLIEANEQLKAWFSFSEAGMSVGKAGSSYSTLTDETGFHVMQLGQIIGSFARRQLAAEAVRIGRTNAAAPRIVIREASDGGAAVVLEELV